MKGPGLCSTGGKHTNRPRRTPSYYGLVPDVQEEHTPNPVHFLTQDTKSPESFSQALHPVEPPLLTAPSNLMAGQHPHMAVGGSQRDSEAPPPL